MRNMKEKTKTIIIFCPNCGRKLTLKEYEENFKIWFEGDCDCGFEIIVYDETIGQQQEGWIEITFC